MDIRIASQTRRFALRAAGIWLHEDKILLQRERDGSEYAIPGGTVQLGETMEETGLAITLDRLLFTEETFWQSGPIQDQCLVFYYQIHAAPTALPPSSEWQPQGDNADILLGWMPLRTFPSITLYPDFLPTELATPWYGVKHFVTR